jgi:hypothetical protein
MLKNHLQELAEKQCEMAVEGLDKIKIWESTPSDNLAGTTGDNFSGSYHFGSTRVIDL